MSSGHYSQKTHRRNPIPSFINLPDGWVDVGNIRPKEMHKKSNAFRSNLIEALEGFWDTTTGSALHENDIERAIIVWDSYIKEIN